MKLLLTVKFHAAGVPALGLLVALAGCASAPARLTTLEADSSPALVLPAADSFEAPVPVRTVKPHYPDDLWHYGMDGDIQLKCLIGEDGVVREAVVMKTSAWELERPSLQAVKQWRFKSAQRHGVPIEQWVIIPLKFFFTD